MKLRVTFLTARYDGNGVSRVEHDTHTFINTSFGSPTEALMYFCSHGFWVTRGKRNFGVTAGAIIAVEEA